MIAATRSHKRVAGERLEDLIKIPANLQKELEKIAQKSKKNVESADREVPLKQTEKTNDVPELPFVDVQPLPVVGRGQTKTNKAAADKDTIEKLLGHSKIASRARF
jgi:hypothetical protein